MRGTPTFLILSCSPYAVNQTRDTRNRQGGEGGPSL